MKCSFCEESASSVYCESCAELNNSRLRKDILDRREKLKIKYQQYKLLLQARKTNEIAAKKVAIFKIKEDIIQKKSFTEELRHKIKCQEIRNEEMKMGLQLKEHNLKQAMSKVFNAKFQTDSIFNALESDIKHELVRCGEDVEFRVWARVIELFIYFPINVDSKYKSFITEGLSETKTFDNIDIESDSISTILGFPFPNSSRYYHRHIYPEKVDKQDPSNPSFVDEDTHKKSKTYIQKKGKRKDLISIIPNSVLRMSIFLVSQVTLYLSKILSIRLPHAILISMENSLVSISEINPLEETQELNEISPLPLNRGLSSLETYQNKIHVPYRSDGDSTVYEKQQRVFFKSEKEWLGDLDEKGNLGKTKPYISADTTLQESTSSTPFKGKGKNIQSQTKYVEDTREIENEDEQIQRGKNNYHQSKKSEWYMLVPPLWNPKDSQHLNSGIPFMSDGRVRAYNYSEVIKIFSGYSKKNHVEESELAVKEDFSDMNYSISLNHFQTALEYLENNILHLCLEAGVHYKTLLPSESILLNLFSLQQHALRMINSIQNQPVSFIGKNNQNQTVDLAKNLDIDDRRSDISYEIQKHSVDNSLTSYQLYQLLYQNSSYSTLSDELSVDNICEDSENQCTGINKRKMKEEYRQDENEDHSGSDSGDLSDPLDPQMRQITLQMKGSLDENVISSASLDKQKIDSQKSSKRERLPYYSFHLNQRGKHIFFKDNVGKTFFSKFYR